MEKRRFRRVPFKAQCVFGYYGISEAGQVETISLNGAMISFHDSLMVPEGETCSLSVTLPEETTTLQFQVVVVYSTLYRIHVQFVSCDEPTRHRMIRLMETLSPEPEKLAEELHLLGWKLPADF